MSLSPFIWKRWEFRRVGFSQDQFAKYRAPDTGGGFPTPNKTGAHQNIKMTRVETHEWSKSNTKSETLYTNATVVFVFLHPSTHETAGVHIC